MSQDEHDHKRNRPLNGDELKRLYRVVSVLMAAAFIFMIATTLLVSLDAIRLYPSSMTEQKLNSFTSRVEYTLRYNTLLVTWLLFNVVITIYGRYLFKAFDPTVSSTEQHMQHYKGILTNSFEQILISILAQLVFVSFASPQLVLKFIPLVNMVQFVGRIGFLIGYPMKRSFGFMCTAVPNVVLVGFNLYKFVDFVLLS